jgi:integrase
MLNTLKVEPRDMVHWDDAVPGFGLRVKPSGVRTWVIQYRNAHGQTRRLSLGPASVLTPEQARARAKIELGRVEEGRDPSGERRMAREAVTVAELCDDYLAAGKGRIKDSTLAMDQSRIDRHVKPLLGSRIVKSLTPADIERFLRDVASGKSASKAKPPTGQRLRGGQTTGGVGVASRTVGMLGTILERAVRDGSIPRNPVRSVRRPKDKIRKPPFSFAILRSVGSALRASAEFENEIALRALRLLLLTGCRRMEVLSLRWDAVDTRASCLRLADTKSGAQIRPIGRTALSVINQAPGSNREHYVFPAAIGQGHFVGLPRVWARVAKRAGIDGVSIHGLRHWFASAAAEMNYSELTIAGLLGHRVRGVTARYATAPDRALVAAADRVSARIASVLDRDTAAEA